MTRSDSPQSRLARRFEEMLEKVRSLRRGGDLEGLIDDEAEEIRRLLYEEALAERAGIDPADQADFPPSAMPEVRHDDGQCPQKGAKRKDAGGQG
jgi:hypothetical protein